MVTNTKGFWRKSQEGDDCLSGQWGMVNGEWGKNPAYYIWCELDNAQVPHV